MVTVSCAHCNSLMLAQEGIGVGKAFCRLECWFQYEANQLKASEERYQQALHALLLAEHSVPYDSSQLEKEVSDKYFGVLKLIGELDKLTGKKPPLIRPGDIVIVDTTDAMYGHVRVPGVVRYIHDGRSGPPEGYYAVAMLIPSGPDQQYLCASVMHNLAQWDLSPDEISAAIGHVVVDRPPVSKSGRVMFIPDDESKTIEQQSGHRQIVG